MEPHWSPIGAEPKVPKGAELCGDPKVRRGAEPKVRKPKVRNQEVQKHQETWPIFEQFDEQNSKKTIPAKPQPEIRRFFVSSCFFNDF